MAELRWKERCSEGLILLLITQLLVPSLGEMICLDSQLRNHLPLQPWSGQVRAMALCRVGTALAFVSRYTFVLLTGIKERVPHRRSGDCVHLIA